MPDGTTEQGGQSAEKETLIGELANGISEFIRGEAVHAVNLHIALNNFTSGIYFDDLLSAKESSQRKIGFGVDSNEKSLAVVARSPSETKALMDGAVKSWEIYHANLSSLGTVGIEFDSLLRVSYSKAKEQGVNFGDVFMRASNKKSGQRQSGNMI